VVEKKVRDWPLKDRQAWINPGDPLSIVRQCQLANVARSTIYVKKCVVQAGYERLLLNLLDEEYTRHPFYGSRKMTVWLRAQGHAVNRKRVQRLMQLLGLVALAPGPNTSKKHPQHKVYPYLLRGLAIIRVNQVWSTDITYIRLAQGFMYLVVIIDWYSRKVLSWQVSNTLDSAFCIDCLHEALNHYDAPEIFNTDQGAQFTSEDWIQVLKSNAIKISMDGRGRALDNIFTERLWRSVKYEDIYLKNYADGAELILGLRQYFRFYNQERYHQALNYKTPNDVYQTATGGGAAIVDHFSDKRNASTARGVGLRVDKA